MIAGRLAGLEPLAAVSYRLAVAARCPGLSCMAGAVRSGPLNTGDGGTAVMMFGTITLGAAFTVTTKASPEFISIEVVVTELSFSASDCHDGELIGPETPLMVAVASAK